LDLTPPSLDLAEFALSPFISHLTSCLDEQPSVKNLAQPILTTESLGLPNVGGGRLDYQPQVEHVQVEVVQADASQTEDEEDLISSHENDPPQQTDTQPASHPGEEETGSVRELGAAAPAEFIAMTPSTSAMQLVMSELRNAPAAGSTPGLGELKNTITVVVAGDNKKKTGASTRRRGTDKYGLK